MTARPIWFIDKAGTIFNLAAYATFGRNGIYGTVYGSNAQIASCINATLDDIVEAISESLDMGEQIHTIGDDE